MLRAAEQLIVLGAFVGLLSASPAPHPSPGTAYAQQGTTDLAVVGISGPVGPVQQGAIVTIDVTVTNLGTLQQTAPVSLHNDTSIRDLNAVTVTLSPGASLTIGFPWDTTSTADGSYTLTASVALTGDQDPTNDSMTLASPISVEQTSIILGDGTGLEVPKASFGSGVASPPIVTLAENQTSIFVGNAQATFFRSIVPVAVTTQPASLQQIFVANNGVTFQGNILSQQPFLQARVQGTVHLQGRDSSVGGFVQVGTGAHFLKPDGTFSFTVPSGPFSAAIKAPGHVAVIIPQVQVAPGQVLVIPELTLPFGDANGDGKIDLLDLSLAGGNFGAVSGEVSVP